MYSPACPPHMLGAGVRYIGRELDLQRRKTLSIPDMTTKGQIKPQLKSDAGEHSTERSGSETPDVSKEREP